MIKKIFVLQKSRLLLTTLFWVTSLSYAIDNPHFYRANFFWDEPRFETPWLTTADFIIGAGKTRKSRNQHGKKSSLLNLYGFHTMQALGKGIENLDPNNPLDLILINLAQIPERENFAQLKFSGDFSTVEGVFNGYQNLVNGFFLQGYLPIRKLAIDNLRFIDESPHDGIFPDKNTLEWRSFLANFPEILNRFGLALNNVYEAGIGDLTILFGWTRNYQDTKRLDFFDVSVKFGILFPTSKTRTLRNPFSLPLGYDGFWGMPVKFDCAIGYWEWFTAGLHIGSLFLMEKEKIVPLKTSLDQQGFITLTRGQAKIDPGTIWDIAGYLKADHIFKGLSLIVGYCYTRKDSDCVAPYDKQLFNKSIVNHDQLFKNWQMHVFHWIIEYDFAKRITDIGPRIALHYNRILGGKRIFNTNMNAFGLGVDIAWCY